MILLLLFSLYKKEDCINFVFAYLFLGGPAPVLGPPSPGPPGRASPSAKVDEITRPPYFDPSPRFHSTIDYPVLSLRPLTSPTQDGKFMLYGHSAGGQFVSRYVVKHPDRIIAAVISAAGSFAGRPGGPLRAGRVRWPGHGQPFAARARVADRGSRQPGSRISGYPPQRGVSNRRAPRRAACRRLAG